MQMMCFNIDKIYIIHYKKPLVPLKNFPKSQITLYTDLFLEKHGILQLKTIICQSAMGALNI